MADMLKASNPHIPQPIPAAAAVPASNGQVADTSKASNPHVPQPTSALPDPSHEAAARHESAEVGANGHHEGEDEDDEEAQERKNYAKCEAKLRRICEPKQHSGKVEADGELVAQWRKKGHSRTQLVKLMMEADGHKDRVHR